MIVLANQQLARCERVMSQRLKPYINTVLSHCQVRSYHISGEPMDAREFLKRVRQGHIQFEEFHIPGLWGTTWGTTWFEIRGCLDISQMGSAQLELCIDLGWIDHLFPGFQAEGLVYRPDGTVLKAVNPLNHWVPLAYPNSTSIINYDDCGNFTLYMEAACNPFVEGPTPFAPTDLGECATGKNECQYELRCVDVVRFNADVAHYFLDLETVSSLIRELREDDPRYWQLVRALQRSLNAYDEHDMTTLSFARGLLASVLRKPAAASSLQHTAVGHAHIDSAWQWPVRETHRKVARTVSNVLALMDEDPDFIYAMSSAQHYEWIEQEHPDLFKRMLERIREGRFIPVGGMWVEADAMMPCGESLVRQLLVGSRYYREHLGVCARGIWLPDSFGYSAAWPQIARRAGFCWFLTQKISWNDATQFPHHSFMWEGIDGTRILTHFPPSDTYASNGSVHELVYSQQNFLDKDLSQHAIVLYGFGDGGGGPTREMTARIRRAHDLEGVPRVDFGTPDECFEQIRYDIVDKAGSETPVYRGELYLQLHRATLTSQQAMKRGCRQEESLLRVVEYYLVLASVYAPGWQLKNDQLEHIWKTLLLNQFHDILPGSAIAWVHRQARQDYERDILQLRGLLDMIVDKIKEANPKISLISQAQLVTYKAFDEKNSWRAYENNSIIRDRSALLPVHVQETQVVTHLAHRLWYSYCDDGSVLLGNGLVSLRVSSDGTVRSFNDMSHQRELIAQGAALGRYELLRDEPYQWDAWDIERDAFCMNRPLSGCIESIEHDDFSIVVHVTTRDDNVLIRTDIILCADSMHLDFCAHVDWYCSETFLKVDIPVALASPRVQAECAYGLVDRLVTKNTRGEEAQFEQCMHRFVRLEEGSYAIGVVNNAIYGMDIAPLACQNAAIREASILRLSLLSAPRYPDPNTDQGEHTFTWSVLACASMPQILELASTMNSPTLDRLPDLPALVSVRTMQGIICIDWLKLAEDNSGDIIVRLVEPAGAYASGVVQIDPILGDCRIEEVSLLEEALDDQLPCALTETNRLVFHPFQISTLRIIRSSRK